MTDQRRTIIPQFFDSGSGLAAAIPAASTQCDGALYYATDTGVLYQVQSGAWAAIVSPSTIYQFIPAHIGGGTATLNTVFGVQINAAGETAGVRIAIPDGVTSVNEASLLVYSSGNITNKNVTVRTLYGASDQSEAYTTHDSGASDRTFSLTGSRIKRIDVGADFAAATGGDAGFMSIVYKDVDVYIIGLLLDMS